MTTEDIHKLEEAKFIKLPSKKEILDTIRYLLSASTLILCIVLVYGLAIQKVTSSYSSYFSLILILLSGLVLASKSYEDIVRPFEELIQAYETEYNHHGTYISLIKHTILITLWVLGLISGTLFLAIVILVFSKISL